MVTSPHRSTIRSVRFKKWQPNTSRSPVQSLQSFQFLLILNRDVLELRPTYNKGVSHAWTCNGPVGVLRYEPGRHKFVLLQLSPPNPRDRELNPRGSAPYSYIQGPEQRTRFRTPGPSKPSPQLELMALQGSEDEALDASKSSVYATLNPHSTQTPSIGTPRPRGTVWSALPGSLGACSSRDIRWNHRFKQEDSRNRTLMTA